MRESGSLLRYRTRNLRKGYKLFGPWCVIIGVVVLRPFALAPSGRGLQGGLAGKTYSPHPGPLPEGEGENCRYAANYGEMFSFTESNTEQF
jgi:hypothetical protein